jgi:hypothetical protein
MPISVYVRDQSCRGALLAYKEDSISNTVNVKAELIQDQLPPDECCNVCNPRLFQTVPFPWDITPSLRKPQAGTASGAFRDRLVLWGDNVVDSTHQMVKPEISVRLLMQKGGWISLSTEYANIGSAAELKKFVESTWLREHCDELFREFNNIKSYVARNWPGASRLRTATGAQGFMSQTPTGRSGSEYSTPQGIGTLFLQERDEYISSLHRVIARAMEISASYSPCPPNRTILSIEPEITSEQLCQRRASLERQAPLTSEHQFQRRIALDSQAPRITKQQMP